MERTSIPIPPTTRDRLIGTFAIPGLGSFAITGEGDGLAISLKEGASEPLYASGPNTFFILSSNLVLQVNSGATPVSGRLVTGPFNVSFQKES